MVPDASLTGLERVPARPGCIPYRPGRGECLSCQDRFKTVLQSIYLQVYARLFRELDEFFRHFRLRAQSFQNRVSGRGKIVFLDRP